MIDESRLDAIRTEAIRAADAPVFGYADHAPLKPPVWTWEVPLYFFAGGAAGAAAMIALAAALSGASEVASRARIIAAGGGVVSLPLLISDLGRPSRFLNMLRVFKLRSPMSVGAWTLALFSPAALATLFRVGAPVSDLVAALSGALLCVYTGVLIGATAIPVWFRHARVLPWHFGASALGAAVSLIELTGPRPAALNWIGVAAALIETAIGAHLERSRHGDARSLFAGTSGIITRVGGTLSGPVPLILRLALATHPAARITAALATSVGSLFTRVGWIGAGRHSASRP